MPDSTESLTALPLLQGLVHGALLQFHLLIWTILTPNCLANVFRGLFPWACSTPFCSAPILPPSFKLPGFLISSELSAQSHMLLPSSFFVLRRPPSAFLLTPSPRRSPRPQHPRAVAARFHSRIIGLLQRPRPSCSSRRSTFRPEPSVCSA